MLFFKYRDTATISRLRTLVAKWIVMVVVALVVSALYLAITTALGMPTPHALLLWGYGAMAIAAIGITATSIVAVFGTAGMLVNIIFFVFLGLPSAGGTVPLEASPAVFRWLAEVEPSHQVYVTVRAILYFDARSDAGLLHGLAWTLGCLVFGTLMGAAVIRFYYHRGLRRANPHVEA